MSPIRKGHSPEQDFDYFWDLLSDEGMCDGRGGAQYRRILALWQEAGYPRPITPYIYAEANAPAPLPPEL